MTTSLLLSDEVLSTTRAVRRRLDFDRPVDPDLVRECVARALQAPSGGNLPMMRFVVVMDEDLRSRVGALYREAYEEYRRSPSYIGRIDRGDPALNERQQRSARSADFLGEHLGDAPALVIGCHLGRLPDGSRTADVVSRASMAIPAMWSFMLAARARGLGTAWTTLHLNREREIAAALTIPYDEVTQVCLSPVAHTRGTDFRPVPRPAPDDVIHWDRWS